jgi:hypothetical protein
MKIEMYKTKVENLLRSLYEESDAEWLLAVYLSLETAEKLGYTHDAFARKSRTDRDKTNLEMLSDHFFSIPASTEDKNDWLAGHCFNNALFRMVALAEITLNDLFKQEMGMEPPFMRYDWLVKWYETKHLGKLKFIGKARARVNKFKHEKRDRSKPKALETYSDGLIAFEELLVLMDLVI